LNEASLRFQLLGGFSVHVNAVPIADDQWRSKRASNLVKLIVLAPYHRLHRDQIIDTFWPNSPLSAAINNLNQALFIARKIIETSGPVSLQMEEGFLRFNGELQIDLEQFEKAASLAATSQDPQLFQTALDLYTGDLLPEDLYEEWTMPRRESLRQIYLKLLLDMATLYETRREYPQGISALQRILVLDRTHEDAHVALMRLFALSGQRQQALRQFQTLKGALQIEFETVPSPSTLTLLNKIQAGQLDPVDAQSQAGEVRYKFNLPLQLTSFIGRENEIADLSPKIKTQRLVTLTGAGGTGKTRLALQVAKEILDEFPHGVFLVELAPLSDPELVPQACLQALDLVQQPGCSPSSTLVRYLENKHSLLILDNCEHILAACTSLVNALLKGCPQLHILATSREILSIPGENSFRVPSLSSPDPRSLPPLEKLSQFEAVRLFVERTVQVSPSFQLSLKNSSAVALICQRLDGIPLAIELAAARMHVMAVDQLASRLDNTFRILTGGSKAVLPRQQTLKATIDWSYDLLAPNERLLLQRLSVFAGGWTLEAAETVCADEGRAENSLSSLDVIDLLTQLVDKSLVIASIQAGGVRYHLLETIRQYARDRLMETGLGVEVRGRHLAYFARLSAEAKPHLRATGMVEWLERLEQELDNFRVALEWSLASNIELGLKIASDMLWFWHFRALFEEEVAHLEKLLAAEAAQRGAGPLEGERALQRARALCTLADQLNYTNHPLAVHVITFLQESVAILRGLGPAARSELGFTLLTLWWEQGEIDALSPRPAEFLEIFEGEKNAFNLSEYYYLRSFMEGNRGRLEEAEALNEKSLAISRDLGDLSGFESRYYNLSFFAWYKGDHARADALLQEALDACRKVKNRWNEPRLRVQRSKRALSRGEHPEAARLAQESLLAFRDLNYLIGMDESLDALQCIAWSRGDLGESLRIGQERLELYAGQLFNPLTGFQRNNLIGSHLYLGRAAISRGDLVEAKRLLKISVGHIAGHEGALNYHVQIHQLLAWIALLSQQKKALDAAHLLGAVDSFYRQIAPSFSPRERSEYEENQASTRTALGEEAFAQAFLAGQAMTLDQALDWVIDEMQSRI
jgi:predicted ATPase/DNA-binding SARP family transcriptional activator